ncbi:MAG: N-acetylneuraminate synthase family protein [Methylophilaceae bacterium]
MYIKDIKKYVVYDSEPIKSGLDKISLNKDGIVFVLNYQNKLIGSFSDGDFRRAILKSSTINISSKITEAMNSQPCFSFGDDQNEQALTPFPEGVKLIPLVDKFMKIRSICKNSFEEVQVGDFIINKNSPSFVIAEIGQNHNGSFTLAKKLIDQACSSGANCVKFQMRNLEELYVSKGKKDSSADLSTQYTMDLLQKFQLTKKEYFQLFDYCYKKNILPLCTPWDISSVDVLEDYGIEGYKVSSADFTNHHLIEYLINTRKPLVCSTGMSTENEIEITVNLLKSRFAEFILLHCNSTYPTPYKDINLNYITHLRDRYNVIAGYSGHERGTIVPIAAVALGAKVIEKHITTDRTMEGNDHKVSLLFSEFQEMVTSIRVVEEALQGTNNRKLTQGELINRENLSKSLTINKKIKKGQLIERSFIEIKSPGIGIKPYKINEIVGKKALRDLNKGDFLFDSDLNNKKVIPRKYNFSRPIGIPVRYHDYSKLAQYKNLDFIEFHLSYQDLDLALNDFFEETQGIEFLVHSPDHFSGDHILDFANKNKSHIERSIYELNRVCDITRQLNKIFKITKKPKIVTNIPGYSLNGFISSSKEKLYKDVKKNLDYVNQDDVEIILQTISPFPWYFGGQCYSNLFVDPDEISSFCQAYNFNLCFDLSHSVMACNHLNINLENYLSKIYPYISHMHISDAEGVDGEGVEIGEGDVDFKSFGIFANKFMPKVQFLPEIWQGHKNNGEGFWNAFEMLEDYFKK